MDKLAEQVLGAIAAQRSEQAHEFVLQADTDLQSRRLIRPLLACLATKSAGEAGKPAELYGGKLLFKLGGSDGPVWISGQFDNRPGNVHITLRRSSSPPEAAEAAAKQPAAMNGPTPSGGPERMLT
ncbi:MAG: hypothetical protein L0Y71_16970 [Gemmataceae bacterium]|nr:hypothetical protein [Gemmataceae bacterium]